MLNITSDSLIVEVLDPLLDRDKMGTRFCTGGQIFQVHDKKLGPLLTGPTYPQSYNSFDSQGLPDGFTVYPGFEDCAIGDPVMVIGVGLARYTHAVKDIFPRVNREVHEWLPWQVQEKADTLIFNAAHDYRDFAYNISRHLGVEKREIRLVTKLDNRCQLPLPLSWFAHPFYPFPKNGIAGRIPSDFEPNPAFGRRQDGQMILRYTPESCTINPYKTFIEGKPDPEAETSVISINHERVGTAEVECRFPVASLPCWYNENTFSPEPYLVTELAPDESLTWEIVYRF